MKNEQSVEITDKPLKKLVLPLVFMITYTLPIVVESWGLLANRFNSLFLLHKPKTKRKIAVFILIASGLNSMN